mmetsp:Transcript_49474/g.105169  ORF Transcript_49474/g.105169 Transcript_49474/m.105169 type:complete len:217 (+) Transcript_49474:975-1625(+)
MIGSTATVRACSSIGSTATDRASGAIGSAGRRAGCAAPGASCRVALRFGQGGHTEPPSDKEEVKAERSGGTDEVRPMKKPIRNTIVNRIPIHGPAGGRSLAVGIMAKVASSSVGTSSSDALSCVGSLLPPPSFSVCRHHLVTPPPPPLIQLRCPVLSSPTCHPAPLLLFGAGPQRLVLLVARPPGAPYSSSTLDPSASSSCPAPSASYILSPGPDR